MTWQLAEPAEGVFLTAENDGVWLRSRSLDFGSPGNLSAAKPKTRLGRLLPALTVQLRELGFAVVDGKSLRIPYPDFVELETNEIDAFQDILPWSPFLLEIGTSGTLGNAGFRYNMRFYLGNEQVHLERIGCFVKRGKTLYRLDRQTSALVEAINNFNSSSGTINATDALLRFAEIKGLSEGVGAEIDSFISQNKIIIPSKIGLDLIIEDDKRITFVPKIDGVSSEGMKKAFLLSGDDTDVYNLGTPEGGRVRVVLDESQKEIFRRMRKIRKIGGADKAKVLSNPNSIFDGVAGTVDIDLQDFGPRVRGIGDFPFVSQPFVSYGTTGIFDDPDNDVVRQARSKLNIGIKCQNIDGREEDILFETRDEFLKFRNTSRLAFENGEGVVDFKGKNIVVDKEFIRGMDALVERVTKPKRERNEESSKQYLLIYTNEAELEYEAGVREPIPEAEVFIPKALKEDVSLKGHQKEGVRWLQQNFLTPTRRGCLLADEMGLGKTLQVLTFLAWLIEKGEIGATAAPWKPILIVAPVTLLENETWVNDMKNFFRGDGEIFTPCLTLHGNKLQEMRALGETGREVEVQKATLDLERLRQYRVILTNYETIVNYQFSFAMMKSDWSVVVTDEAQEYKTSSTKISHALKSLSPKFRIACTGTPVETKLGDVWNIFDFLQPGNLLGSASEFSSEYERPLADSGDNNHAQVLDKLRDRLRLNKPDGYLFRRDKSTLKDLPKKHEHKEYCTLSSGQRERYLDFINRARAEGNHHLALIQQIMKLYQHPALLPRYQPFDKDNIHEAREMCPKLEKVMNILHDIGVKQEKALIFTRSLDMQELLKSVIDATFRKNTDIVNGLSSRRGSARHANNSRKEMINRFRNSKGFDVIILSPDVAGIGLTLVEANHVIHYGRWWNPAKEAQATDRVYRIGQKKDVHVYYPIARDPEGKFKTFDEKLDDLIERRRALAADFLAPIPGEDKLEQELLTDILHDGSSATINAPIKYVTKEDVKTLPWDRFESLVALIEQKQGCKSVLLLYPGAYGFDVISINDNELRLIQCKHTQWDASVEADVIVETISALDSYRGRLLRDIANEMTMKPLLVTNGKFTRAARQEALIRDVQLVSSQDFWQLLEKHPCTLAEIEIMESRRLKSISEVKAAIMRGNLG